MKIMVAISALACLFAFSGCAGMYSAPVVPPTGMVYADMSAPMSLDAGTVSANAKVGKAKSTCILGLVATGDASVKAAAAEGDITEIQQVDYHIKNILGVFSEFTTVVYGK